jgi:hypothetical protein
MEVSRYHRFLRVSLVIVALLLVFDSGVLFPITKVLSDNTLQYLGSVGTGVFASVPQNEINTLTAQISERERALDARESQLQEREIAARRYETTSGPDYSTYIISFILFILSVLMVLNYAMDWTRVKQGYYAKQVS